MSTRKERVIERFDRLIKYTGSGEDEIENFKSEIEGLIEYEHTKAIKARDNQLANRFPSCAFIKRLNIELPEVG